VGASHYTVKAAARPPHSTGALSKLNPRVLLDAPQKHGNTLRYAREKDAALLEHFRRAGWNSARLFATMDSTIVMVRTVMVTKKNGKLSIAVNAQSLVPTSAARSHN
jgi:hypothetical protein